MRPKKGDRIRLGGGWFAIVRRQMRHALIVRVVQVLPKGGLGFGKHVRLLYVDEGVHWARGWNTKAAQALLAARALL